MSDGYYIVVDCGGDSTCNTDVIFALILQINCNFKLMNKVSETAEYKIFQVLFKHPVSGIFVSLLHICAE